MPITPTVTNGASIESFKFPKCELEKASFQKCFESITIFGRFVVNYPNSYCNKWLKLLVLLPPRPSHRKKGGEGYYDSKFSLAKCAVDTRVHQIALLW